MRPQGRPHGSQNCWRIRDAARPGREGCISKGDGMCDGPEVVSAAPAAGGMSWLLGKALELETGDAQLGDLERSVRQDLGHLCQPRSGLGRDY